MRQISVPLPFPGKRIDPDRWLNNLLQNSSIYSTFAKKANTKPPQLLVKKELEVFFFIQTSSFPRLTYCKPWPVLLVYSTSCVQNRLAPSYSTSSRISRNFLRVSWQFLI